MHVIDLIFVLSTCCTK